METDGKFYLGRIFDPTLGKTTEEALLYEPEDLTTHAVVVGMTGSGKTGLCIDLLEEAALNNIPALMIDPKGDITNALLHFPEMRPEDFEPWVNPDQARREGKTSAQAAQEASDLWRKGLADWGISPERVQALKDSAEFAVYTPGSDAGIAVSILASLKAPLIPWAENREVLRERISGTATALLGLVGMTDIDPVRSREHILLANIFEHAWSQGKDLDLSELILQTQTPPFTKLGVFDVNTFFPERDRFGLAMLLNNILAAPAFQTWIEGVPLDIPSLLYTPEGKPRHSVFYIAHLNDAERMFFVTLLFSVVETWMRTQPGTGSLRTLVYFDEIYGYLPPVSNPPSKLPMLRMLKQARAFGVGLVLVTQNPVDLDYKALSNAGTWFIGKLQTDRDKQRLLDGLEGAMAGNVDRQAYDKMISGLGKRVFLLHNVHSSKAGLLFQTRWAMNYLTGPLTRNQIPGLNQLAGEAHKRVQPWTAAAAAPIPAPADTQPVRVTPAAESFETPDIPKADVKIEPVSGSSTRPMAPVGVDEFFLPVSQTPNQALRGQGREMAAGAEYLGVRYKPAVFGQVEIRYFNRKYGLDYADRKTAVAPAPDRRGVIRWENYLSEPLDVRKLDGGPEPQARFDSLEGVLGDAKLLASLEKDFVEWAYRGSKIAVKANELLKVYGGPDVSPAEFLERCAEEARKQRDVEARKIEDGFDKKINAVQLKLTKEERELDEDETQFSQRRMEEYSTHAENVFDLFRGRGGRKVSSSLSKRRMTEQAKANMEESKAMIKEYQKQLAALEADKAAALEELNARWGEAAKVESEVALAPQKKDVLVEAFGIVWRPYHLLRTEGRLEELEGF